MTDLIDAVNPANITADYDGHQAGVITVLANPTAQIFDLESGNAPAGKVAQAIALRFQGGWWSWLYVNETTEADGVAAVQAAGVPLLGPNNWPRPGCYLWCADPSGNIAAGRWSPRDNPVAVQDRYPGPYDLSRVYVSPCFTVAGYLDGPESEWPASAWQRFTYFPNIVTVPSPTPAPEPAPTEKDDRMYCFCVDDNPASVIKKDTQWLLDDYRHQVFDQAAFTAKYGDPVGLSANQIAQWPAPPTS